MMPGEIAIGAGGHAELQIGDEHCTVRGTYKILSTPNMVSLLERAAINTLQPFLGEDAISVGTRVDVQHLAPSLKGAHVRANAIVRAVEGATVRFDVDLLEGNERVGTAVHERHVLDKERYMRRLASRAASTGTDA